MKKARLEQENRNEKTSDFMIFIAKIRDWLGFIFTVAGFCLSLSGTVHINNQVQFIVAIEIYNYISEVDENQWNLGGFLLNLKDDTNNTRKNDTSGQKYPIEWAYVSLTECSLDIPKRKKLRSR